MGADLSEVDSHPVPETDISLPPWLDPRTTGLVRAITSSVAHCHPNLHAVILYGSVARHDERALDTSEPSDVDLLMIFNRDPGLTRLTYEQEIAISHSIGLGRDCYPDAPREVQVMVAVGDLTDWDPTFVESVARDGLLLWARGPLPARLAAVASRMLPEPTS